MLHMIPSDTILDYYPTTWSYIGEHFLAWAVFAVPIFTLFFGTHWRVSGVSRLRDIITIAWISMITEVLSSAYLWFIANPVGAAPKLWWRGGFSTYLLARSPSWVIAFLLILVIGLFIDKRRATRAVAGEHV